MKDSKLNIHEFFDELLFLTDENIFSNIYIDENIEFFKEINLYLYEHYLEDRMTLNLASNILESFIKSMLKHTPSLHNVLRDDFGNIEE
jgi:hypothetical protein